MKKITLFCFLLGASFQSLDTIAQEKVKYTKEELKEMDNILFDENFIDFSRKKNSTIILKDGTIIEAPVSNIKRKKLQITSIDAKVNNKKTTYQAEEIAEIYLPISGIAKSSKVASYFGNVNNWTRKSLKNSTNPNDVFVKNIKASLKNKKEEKEFLMQLINPEFSSIIEVYSDPAAKETTGVSFGGGPQIGGGSIKSYYIKKGEEVIWLKKAEFEDQYDFLFGDNKEFMNKYPLKSVKWDYLSYLILQYTKMSS